MRVRWWQDLTQWVWSWYADDRIRVSPAEGRLMRIFPGDLITLNGIDATVIDRSISERSAGLCIRLMASKGHGVGELQVTVTDLKTTQLVWTEAGISRQVDENEVQVWPRNR